MGRCGWVECGADAFGVDFLEDWNRREKEKRRKRGERGFTGVVFGQHLEGGVAVDTGESVADYRWRKRDEGRLVLVGMAEGDEPQKGKEDEDENTLTVTVLVVEVALHHAVGAN